MILSLQSVLVQTTEQSALVMDRVEVLVENINTLVADTFEPAGETVHVSPNLMLDVSVIVVITKIETKTVVLIVVMKALVVTAKMVKGVEGIFTLHH